ncbi:MAG: N-acetylmuramoyl-L-alanine amidase [Bacteroidales bacterium]|nr:N-acetylmuramoyl-L-alanine amidase [Bacteroidales bacterium]
MMRRILTSIILLLVFSLAGLSEDKLSLTTVVIDPGHGGKDPGAVSKDGNSYEKTFVLDIASTLAEKIREGYPDVKVIMTRSTDHFVTLNDRAEIANKAGANLFISVHINSAGGTTANGYSVHVLGQSHKEGTDLYKMNLAMVQRENAVITLDDDYNPATADFNPNDPESYIFMTMMQSAYLEQSISFAEIIGDKLASGPIKNSRGVSQDPFYVLWKTSMPAVLVELGFISNEQDLATLKQEKQRESLAECLYQAFKEYKTEYDKSMEISPRASLGRNDKEEVGRNDKTVKTDVISRGGAAEVEKSQGVKYGVQIASLSKELPEGDPRLLGYKLLVKKSANGKLYRHVIGISETKEEARSKMASISKKYPDCFLVKIEGDSVSRVN